MGDSAITMMSIICGVWVLERLGDDECLTSN